MFARGKIVQRVFDRKGWIKNEIKLMEMLCKNTALLHVLSHDISLFREISRNNYDFFRRIASSITLK